MIYINNKNNRKLIFSEKVYVSYYICIYVWIFFLLIDFKYYNVKLKF